MVKPFEFTYPPHISPVTQSSNQERHEWSRVWVYQVGIKWMEIFGSGWNSSGQRRLGWLHKILNSCHTSYLLFDLTLDLVYLLAPHKSMQDLTLGSLKRWVVSCSDLFRAYHKSVSLTVMSIVSFGDPGLGRNIRQTTDQLLGKRLLNYHLPFHFVFFGSESTYVHLNILI